MNDVKSNDKKNGLGILTSKNGDQYIGEFLNDQKSGKGKLTTDISVYEGDFLNGKYNGSG